MNTNSGPRPAGRALIRMGSALLAAAVVAGTVLGSGCSRPTGNASAPPVKGERYPLTGQILRIEPERKVLVVRHDEIKDYMPAMTMEFVVAAGDLAVVQVGQRIRADLVPAKDGGDFRLERIWPDDKVSADTISASALRNSAARTILASACP